MDPGREEHLIRRCAKNDRKAQKEVYEYYYTTMYAICKRYLKNDDDALEAVNNGMLAVLKSISHFEFKGSFEGWMKRIVINKSLDLIRAQKGYKGHVVLEEEIGSYGNATIENDAVSNISFSELYAIIRELPESHRVVFNLYAIEGYSHSEIGDKMGITSSTSRWYLTKARQILQEKLKKKNAEQLLRYG